MPKPQVIQQLASDSSQAYQMASPENDIAALKMKLGEFERTQKEKKFSLVEEGIKQKIYNGEIDEITGYNKMLEEASKIGLDEQSIAKLNTKIAQSKYESRKAAEEAYRASQKSKELTDEEVKMMLEDEVENLLTTPNTVIGGALYQTDKPVGTPTFEDLRNYFYKSAYTSRFTKQTIDTVINQRMKSLGIDTGSSDSEKAMEKIKMFAQSQSKK